MRLSTDPVSAIIDTFAYQWETFEIQHFVNFIAGNVHRTIRIVSVDCAPGISAVWIHMATCEFIFVRAAAAPVLQTHSILHEIGHIVLGHRGYHIPDEQRQDWIQSIAANKSSIMDKTEEQEAEHFAVTVYMRARLARRRLQETTTAFAAFRPLIDSGF
jgi:IrrE N-terminal-like domain